jgi:uncharacterized membrane protein YfcA
MDWFILVYAGVVALIAMFLGAISGGISLILMPALILIGVPIQTVISSTKVASLAGIIPSLKILHDKGHVDWRLVALMSVPSILGSIAAGFFVISIASGVLSPIFGAVLICIAILLFFREGSGEVSSSRIAPIGAYTLAVLGTLVLSFFRTIVGGLGPLFITLYAHLFGITYTRAATLARGIAFP